MATIPERQEPRAASSAVASSAAATKPTPFDSLRSSPPLASFAVSFEPLFWIGSDASDFANERGPVDVALQPTTRARKREQWSIVLQTTPSLRVLSASITGSF